MPAQLFGIEHILYIIISTLIGCTILIPSFIFVKNEKAKTIIIKILAGALFVAIMTNRLSQVFRYGLVRWEQIIPDSYCGMTSLLISLGALFGKKDNPILHFTWLIGIFGGISTVIYATFVSQGPTIFYLPTISGLFHHSLSAILVVALLMFKQINITYKKWYYSVFAFTGYITIGSFLMNIFNINDAFHIVEPLLPNTPLTAWVMAPIYAFVYGLILFIIEMVRMIKNRRGKKA